LEIGRSTTWAVLLAAGEGSRFIGSSHKLQVLLRGRAVYQWAIEALHGAMYGSIRGPSTGPVAAESAASMAGAIVVTGAVELDLPDWVVRADNPNWSSGQAGSLHVGLAAAHHHGAEAVVVGLADQPFVTSAAWLAVARANSPIAVATYGGVRGHPVRLHRTVWPLLSAEGDQGARSLMIQRPELVGEVACEGSAADIDTMEDLQRWNSSTNS
jgi:CTP:molybdopterin cytidylyltransferase MocA